MSAKRLTLSAFFMALVIILSSSLLSILYRVVISILMGLLFS
mgnify:CR=1 FL=1